MKLDKMNVVQRRIDILKAENIEFLTGVEVGFDIDALDIKEKYNAVLIATGSTIPRDIPIRGRDLSGIHYAMEFLTKSTKDLLSKVQTPNDILSARDKKVIVIGGGDTGNDCIATCIRQGCQSVVNFELLPKSPAVRSEDNPWPQWPKIFRVDYGHAESKNKFNEDPRQFCVMSKEFIGDESGRVCGIRTIRIRWFRDGGRWKFEELAGTERTFRCDMVLLALGFIGPERRVLDQLGVAYDSLGNVAAQSYRTSTDGIFAAGDCRRGQSLIVWGIREGRDAAREIDQYLSRETL
jgi:NAD(P)H-dependent glutamate synthase small subunit